MQIPLNLLCREFTYPLKCIFNHHVRKCFPSINAETAVLKVIRPMHFYPLRCVKEELITGLSWAGLPSVNQPFGLTLLYFQPRNCSIISPCCKIFDYLRTLSWEYSFQTSFSALGRLSFFLRLADMLLEKPENRNRGYFKKAGDAPHARTHTLHPCLCEQLDLGVIGLPSFLKAGVSPGDKQHLLLPSHSRSQGCCSTVFLCSNLKENMEFFMIWYFIYFFL